MHSPISRHSSSALVLTITLGVVSCAYHAPSRSTANPGAGDWWLTRSRLFSAYYRADHATSSAALCLQKTPVPLPETEVLQMAWEILAKADLAPNFVLHPVDGLCNAGSDIDGSNRFVIYDPAFLTALNAAAKSKWPTYAILAHEIGHHLQAHTLTPGQGRPYMEIEADEFSGSILARMKATLADAQSGVNLVASTSAQANYPSREERLKAVERGFRRFDRGAGHFCYEQDDANDCRVRARARAAECSRLSYEPLQRTCNEVVACLTKHADLIDSRNSACQVDSRGEPCQVARLAVVEHQMHPFGPNSPVGCEIHAGSGF